MKRLVWFTIVILATLSSLFLLWQVRTAILLFLLALTITAALRPPVDRLTSRGFSAGLASFLIYAVVVGALLGLLLLFGGRLFNDVQQLLADATEHYQQIQAEWSQGTPFQQVIVQQLTPLSDLSQAIAGEQGMAFMQTLLGITLSSLDLLGQVIIILVLSIYWSSDQERFKRLWLSLFPAETRARMRASWQAIEDGVGAYVRSEFVQSSLALLLLALGYSVLGLKYPILLALTGAIGWLLPWVGVLLAVIPAFLVGLLLSPGLALGAVAYSLAILSFLELVVEPRFFNRRRFSSLLVVIVMLVLVDEYGLIGLLLAPPLAGVLQIVANQVIRSASSAATPPPINQLEVLQTRLTSFQDRLAQRAEAPSPELLNITARLTHLVERARQEEALRKRVAGEAVEFDQTQPGNVAPTLMA
ncbi:hypothetical protein TFLX_04616 [Thermoflexales bacterium]|nr:hypothetical protein TFLX_04616 [Thermoflexales bacterium]